MGAVVVLRRFTPFDRDGSAGRTEEEDAITTAGGQEKQDGEKPSALTSFFIKRVFVADRHWLTPPLAPNRGKGAAKTTAVLVVDYDHQLQELESPAAGRWRAGRPDAGVPDSRYEQWQPECQLF